MWNLGKDFWKILSLLRFLIEAFAQWSKENNGDTPKGQE